MTVEPLLLQIAPDLIFSLQGFPDRLCRRVKSFFAYYLSAADTSPGIATVPIVAVGSIEDCADAALVAIDGPIILRQMGAMVRFEIDGVVALCDLARGNGTVALDRPSETGLDLLTARVLPTIMVQLAQQRGWLGVHAAAVSSNGAGGLLPGPSGVGKSTVFRTAAAAGLGLLSDDLVWLEPTGDGWRLRPFPRMALVEPAPEPTVAEAKLAAIFCPQLHPGQNSSLHPIEAAEVVTVLAEQAGVHLGNPCVGDLFRTVVRIADAMPCYRLLVGTESSDIPALLGDAIGRCSQRRRNLCQGQPPLGGRV